MKQHKTPSHRKLDEDYARRSGGNTMSWTQIMCIFAGIAVLLFVYLVILS
ncbi:MAG: hypothetical protein AAGI27_14880 [Pseudomonadota bacterium]